jgi:hypothetical protein
MEDSQVRDLLHRAKTIAVVGMSDKPERDSYAVGAYLLGKGYRVIPVNPSVTEILGQRSYPSLQDIPAETAIDIVDVFRKSEAVPAILDEVLSRPSLPKAIWLQIGVRDEASKERARSKNLTFIQDTCIMVQHRRLFPG